MVARKAPKAMHYSGSESLDYRVSAAVSQKNEGRAYLLQVCAFISAKRLLLEHFLHETGFRFLKNRGS